VGEDITGVVRGNMLYQGRRSGIIDHYSDHLSNGQHRRVEFSTQVDQDLVIDPNPQDMLS